MKEKLKIEPSIPDNITDLEGYLEYQLESQRVMYEYYKKETSGTAKELVQRGYDLVQVANNLEALLAEVKKLELAKAFLKNGNNIRAIQLVQNKIDELNDEANIAFQEKRNIAAWKKVASINILRRLIT